MATGSDVARANLDAAHNHLVPFIIRLTPAGADLAQPSLGTATSIRVDPAKFLAPRGSFFYSLGTHGRGSTMHPKRTMPALTGFLLLVTLGAGSAFRVVGSGHVTETDRPTSAFSQLLVEGGIDLDIRQGKPVAIRIETDDNLQEYVHTEHRNGILRVYVRDGVQLADVTRLEALVTVEDLARLSVAGGGDVHMGARLNTESLDVSVGGGGDLRLSLATGRLRSTVSGGGDARIEGAIGEANLSMSGGGNLELVGSAEVVAVSMSGGGDARLVSEDGAAEVRATLSGGGDLELNMPCSALDVKVTGGGDVVARAGSGVFGARVKITGGGDLDLTLDVEKLDVSMTGGGDASLAGTADVLNATMVSGGDLKAKALRAGSASVRLSGGSDASLFVEDRLDIRATGGARVSVKGDPVIESSLSGGATLQSDAP